MDMDTQSSTEELESQVSQHEEAASEAVPKMKIDLGLLIEAVQQYPYLYDLSHKQYKDAKKKYQAWQQIAQLLNCSVDDCMKSWKNVRDRFVKEKKMSMGVSGCEAWESNWPFYNDMLFYTTFTKTRNTYTATAPKKMAGRSQVSSYRATNAKIGSQRSVPGRQSTSGPRTSVWSTMDTLTSPSPEPEIQDENVPPKNAFSPIPSCSYRPSHYESSGRPVPSCSYTKASSRLEAFDENLANETPRSTSFRKPRAKDDASQTQEDVSESSTSSSRKVEGMERVLDIANSLVQKLGQKNKTEKNKNAVFVEYLFHILEGLSEEEAGTVRRHILQYLCDQNLD